MLWEVSEGIAYEKIDFISAFENGCLAETRRIGPELHICKYNVCASYRFPKMTQNDMKCHFESFLGGRQDIFR